MERVLVNYFCIVAAFILMLDSTISVFHLISILILLSVCLYKQLRRDLNVEGFLETIRSVCRTE